MAGAAALGGWSVPGLRNGSKPRRRGIPLNPIDVAVAVAFGASRGSAQGRPDSASLLAAQRDALKPLGYMDGVWRGPAWTILANGQKHEVTQTERIGPALGAPSPERRIS